MEVCDLLSRIELAQVPEVVLADEPGSCRLHEQYVQPVGGEEVFVVPVLAVEAGGEIRGDGRLGEDADRWREHAI